MKRLVLTLALLAGSLSAAPEDDLAAARTAATDLAGAWSNDGFKLRDAFWSGIIKAGEPKIIQVNLYAGNQYWFTLAASDPSKKVAIAVFDETGKAIPCDNPQEGARAAAGFSPTASGPYLVKIQSLEGESTVALFYSYK